MEKGKDCRIDFRVDCNPPLPRGSIHTLTKDGNESFCKHFNDSTIHLTDLSIEDKGMYTIKSSNEAGEGSGSIKIDVIGKFKTAKACCVSA